MPELPIPAPVAKVAGRRKLPSLKMLGLMALAPVVLVGGGVGAMWLLADKAPPKTEEAATTEATAPAGAPAADVGLTSRKNLKQIGLAFLTYHDDKRRFPPAAVYSKDGTKPLYSWRVELLPYLEQKELYDQFKKDEPFDSPHNKTLWAKMPSVYALPDKPGDPTQTYYQVFTGDKAPFHGPKGQSLGTFSDGAKTTILVAESATAVNWAAPVDLPFAPTPAGFPPAKLGGHYGDTINVLMADGSTHEVKRSIPPLLLQGAITPAGREHLGADWTAALVQ